eukprot:9623830-Alexandrium_andersonii.AAC.1
MSASLVGSEMCIRDRCSRRGAEKPRLVTLAADAAQMYENLEAAQVIQTLEALIRVAASKGYVGMA